MISMLLWYWLNSFVDMETDLDIFEFSSLVREQVQELLLWSDITNDLREIQLFRNIAAQNVSATVVTLIVFLLAWPLARSL